MNDDGGSNASGWVRWWPVGGALWVGGVDRSGGGGAVLKSLSNWHAFSTNRGFQKLNPHLWPKRTVLAVPKWCVLFSIFFILRGV
jgi:hypothetical protein